MKNEIINDLKNILSNLDYYRSKKDIIRFLTKLDNLVNNKKDLLVEILNEIIDKIEKKELNDKTLINIEKTIFGFLVRNEKTYLNRNITKDRTVYEYKDKYSIYLNNKNIDINKLIETEFKDLEVISATLDGVKWKNINNINKEDIENSKIIKIDIKKF